MFLREDDLPIWVVIRSDTTPLKALLKLVRDFSPKNGSN